MGGVRRFRFHVCLYVLGALGATAFLGCGGGLRQPAVHAAGVVNPRPAGCIYMQFAAPTDDSLCWRKSSGEIEGVITPIQRREPLIKKWPAEGLDAAVRGRTTNDTMIPGPVAWDYVKKYIRPTDEIWSFGVLDRGIVVIRDNRVYCIVVTEHMD